MKIDEFLASAIQQLSAAGISTARLDCLVLLEDVLNTNRTQILAHPERKLTEVEAHKLDAMLARRSNHVPLAYVRGKTEFYGRDFAINTHVLEPRPESETMLDMLQELAPAPRTIVDVGTGSGALAITAKRLVPNAIVYAIDIDDKCLQLAKRNATSLNADITFLSGNLIEPLRDVPLNTPLILLCNLPYVPDEFHINRAATHEPRLALFGGPDGLDLYRQLFVQITGQSSHHRPEAILAESLPPQHEVLASIAANHGYRMSHELDFIQLFTPQG